MTSMDIAALGAAPPTDASCASADTPASAADAFAALLDEASATGGADAPSHPRTSEDVDDGEENFDELAALAMTSLLSIGPPVPPPVTDAGDADEIADAEIAGTEITATDITGQAVVTDVTARAVLVEAGKTSWQATTPSTTIGNDMGVDASNAPVMIDTPGATAAAAPETMPESASADAPTTDAAVKAAATAAPVAETGTADTEGNRELTRASAGKAEAEITPQARTSRSSKPSRSLQAHDTHKADALNADAVMASSPANVAQTIEAARASAPTQQTTDVRPSGSTAVRFARALERAAAPAASEKASSAASTASANGGGSGQPSGFGGSSPDPAAQLSAAVQRSVANVNVMAFAVNGPAPIDMRAMAADGAAAAHVDNAPVAIPERDVIAQLVQSMRVQFRDGIGEAVLKLNPEHLGSVQISLRIENGAIRATVQAEVPAVRQWLESQQETLRTSLADQGLRLERFVVEPDGERRASEDDAREQKQERRRQQHRRRMSEKDHPLFEVTV